MICTCTSIYLCGRVGINLASFCNSFFYSLRHKINQFLVSIFACFAMINLMITHLQSLLLIVLLRNTKTSCDVVLHCTKSKSSIDTEFSAIFETVSEDG